MKSIDTRLRRLEQIMQPVPGVGIAVALDNGAWEFSFGGRRAVCKSLTDAERRCPPNTHIIVIDI